MIYSVNNSLYSNLPNTAVTNGEYLFWFPYWQVIRDCLMGEIMVKMRRTKYLPKTESQTDAEYNAYLLRATFYNATASTLTRLVGSVHIKPPVIDGVPDALDLSSVTGDGQSFDMFMKKITKEVIALGRYGVMIDAPEGGGDPYMVGYDTEDIVDWASERTGSREKLKYVVLREIIRKRLPFTPLSNDVLDHYRVLFIDDDGIYKQRLYENGQFSSSDYVEYVPLMQGSPMTEIPFLLISPYDFGYQIEKPPMLDIALMNLSHYHSYAQLEAGRYYTATPIYKVSLAGGGDEDAEFKIGPNTVWQMGQDDTAEILEFTGQGLRFLESALTTKEQQITALGGKLATQPTGTAAESPDAVLARAQGEAGFLGSIISTLSEAASRLLSAYATWHGNAANVKVAYPSEASEMNLDAREIRAMQQLYDTGLLPLDVIFTIFRHNNIIPASVSLEDFKAMLPKFTPKVQNALDQAEETAKIDKKYAPPAPVAPKVAPVAPKAPPTKVPAK